MARIDTGNDLTADQLQPGWMSSADGFGLVTINATFKSDAVTGSFTSIDRGTPFPVSAYNYCKCHKGTVSWDALGIATIKVDYVGIYTGVNGGNRTNANTTVANGLSAEHISTHPHFFSSAAGYYGNPLAGLPTNFGGAYNDSELGPVVNRYNTTTKQMVPVPSCEGYHGACFEQPNGGRFIGFVDPDYPDLYGKTQYLSRTTTYSGVIYTKNVSEVQALYALLGTATSTRSWGILKLIPDWGPIGTGPEGDNCNLLSQVNVEEYGLLYKVIYEIRYSAVGWSSRVYLNI